MENKTKKYIYNNDEVFDQSEANREFLISEKRFNDEHFTEYQKLGGKENRKTYDNMREVFIDHTHHAYVAGITGKNGTNDANGFFIYSSRAKSCQAVMNELDITDDEFEKLFHSIDNVTAWT